MYTNPDKYCLKTIYGICQYLATNYKHDILKMMASFVKDDDGKLWLFQVRDLVVKAHPKVEVDESD